MELYSSCNGVFCALVGQIDWLWYVLSILAVYVVGALWYSVLFRKMWLEVFKVKIPTKPSGGNMFVTFFGQLVATALMGLVIFIITPVSVWLAVIMVFAVCGWQKGSLKYQFAEWREYFRAAWVTAGYTFVAGVIFILFALIR